MFCFLNWLSVAVRLSEASIPNWRKPMYDPSDLRKGLKIEVDGYPYLITEFDFCKPGKGQALYRCKLKNLVTGGTMERTFRSVDKIGQPVLEEKTLYYSYDEQDDNYVFMDDNNEEYRIPGTLLDYNKYLLEDNMECVVLFYQNKPIDITLPFFVEKEITETEPGARGDTATNVSKPAKIENGYEISVPLFINVGDIVKIDTRTGQYAERVRKGGN